MVPIFENCFLFKKNKENEENNENTFDSQFFFVLKNTKIREHEQFSKNTKMMFSVVSKTVLKNSFQKQEPNRSLVFYVFSVFSEQKKNWEPNVFSLFSLFSLFLRTK